MIKGTVATVETGEKDKTTVQVKTPDAGTVEIQKENIGIIRNDEEQANYEAEQNRLLDPGFTDLWSGSADVGFSLTSGNSGTKRLTVGARAGRETTRDKISVYANAIQASNSTSGVKEATAQAVWFGGNMMST